MRRTPPTIHFIAVTDAAFSTATMSYRPYHRGRRSGFFGPGRSYSGGRDQLVTGDDHLQSVRNANSELRRGESGGNFANQTQYNQHPPYNPRPYHPPSPHYQNPQFRQPPPPHQYQNPSFRHPPPPQFQNPPFRHLPPPQFQNPQFRHGPPYFRPSPPFDQGRPFRQSQNSRPQDYRGWELALTPPPPRCERFKVLSYNILADYLAVDHRRKLYFHVPPYVMDWQRRKSSIIFELGLWSADIMCFQEVDRFHEFAEDLKLKGYNGIWKMRTGNPVDGCAIFWRTSRFKLLYEECIEFNKLGLRDNVAQICVLEFINQNGSLSSSLTGSCKVVVCNIHVLYNPNRGEIKLGQVRILLDKAQAVSKLWNNAPVIICGDFNCTPKSPLYNFIAEQKLDLSGIDRDKVSGQASAVIRPPKLYGPNSSEKSSANGSAPVTSTVGDKEVNIEQNNSLSDMQNSDKKSNSSENQYTHTELDMSDKTNVDCRRESDAYAGNDTQEAADHNMVFVEVSVKEEPSPSYNEVRPEPTGIGSTENISDAISTSNQDALSENSNLQDYNGNKNIESNCSPTSLQEDDQASKLKIDLESADLPNEEISSNRQSSQTLVSGAFEISHQGGYRESSYPEVIANDQINCSATAYQVDKSQQLTNIEVPIDEKLEKLFLDEVDKTDVGCDNIGDGMEELDSTSNNLLPAESIDMEDDLSPSPVSKSTESYRTTYNPSLWTPAEIETATGNAECTFLEHPLPLRSTYTEAMGCSGTRDPHGEPQVTSYNRCFLGTVDYIWRSAGLQTTRVLAPIPKHAMEWTPGFPTKKWGSDHIALVSELAFLKDDNDINKDV